MTILIAGDLMDRNLQRDIRKDGREAFEGIDDVDDD